MRSAQSLAGKTILVTGASSGIGLETARTLAKMGATVVVGARDAARGQAVVDEIVRDGGSAELLMVDLGSFASVREAARRFEASHSSLAVLVNNAGTAVRERTLSTDGHELTWQTNFLSTVLLTRLLLPLLARARNPRIVNVASEAHRAGRIVWNDLELERGYATLRAYSNSKLALVLFTRELARREPGIAVNAVHPGAIATGIWRAAPALARWALQVVLPPPRRGAEPVVHVAASSNLDGVTGRYFDRMREVEPEPAAKSAEDALRLWQVAEEATGSY